MNETKHTPFLPTPHVGPQNEYIEEFEGDQLRGRILYNGVEVATLSYLETWEFGRLYAAAPDLLAACRALLGVVEQITLDSPLISSGHTAAKAARAAIAQATGEPQPCQP